MGAAGRWVGVYTLALACSRTLSAAQVAPGMGQPLPRVLCPLSDSAPLRLHDSPSPHVAAPSTGLGLTSPSPAWCPMATEPGTLNRLQPCGGLWPAQGCSLARSRHHLSPVGRRVLRPGHRLLGSVYLASSQSRCREQMLLLTLASPAEPRD